LALPPPRALLPKLGLKWFPSQPSKSSLFQGKKMDWLLLALLFLTIEVFFNMLKNTSIVAIQGAVNIR
jgi:hypothetical protein